MQEGELFIPSDASSMPATTIELSFRHPSSLYSKLAFLAAIVVCVGSFFGSMIGEGEANYDLLQYGAFGCCSLLNLAFILQAVYTSKRIQYNENHGLEEKIIEVRYLASVLLAVFGMVILFGNLFSGY